MLAAVGLVLFSAMGGDGVWAGLRGWTGLAEEARTRGAALQVGGLGERWGGGWRFLAVREPETRAVEAEVDDGRRVEREDLADGEAADDGDAEGAAEFGASTFAER